MTMTFDSKGGKLAAFNRLTSDTRVDYVIQQSEYYGCSGDRVKGLVFCSRNNEAEELSRKFNQRGLRTAGFDRGGQYRKAGGHDSAPGQQR